jgi:(2Fe-2S) ferredoxin
VSYYRHHVFFCTNFRADGRACCQNHQAQEARDYVKSKIKELGESGPGRIRINQAGCLDRCGLGPVLVVYPEAVWYRYESHDDLDEIVEQHLLSGEIVTRLQI